ncbi:hypothetical protein ACFE04_031596 [Oxalis oulophora]
MGHLKVIIFLQIMMFLAFLRKTDSQDEPHPEPQPTPIIRPPSAEEESCCRWSKEIDDECICDWLVRLPLDAQQQLTWPYLTGNGHGKDTQKPKMGIWVQESKLLEND